MSDTGLLRLALQYSSWLGVRLMEHPEEKSLTKDAQVNEGICSSFSGLKGWPSSAEASDISRGVSLCRDTGVPIHFTHVSAEDSLRVLREAKASKLPVTFDVTPHHLCLSEENVIEGGYDSVFKVNPPSGLAGTGMPCGKPSRKAPSMLLRRTMLPGTLTRRTCPSRRPLSG